MESAGITKLSIYILSTGHTFQICSEALHCQGDTRFVLDCKTKESDLLNLLKCREVEIHMARRIME